MQRLKENLEIGVVIVLLAANFGGMFLDTVVLAAAQRTHPSCWGGLAVCALFVFHFLAHCALFGRFLDLTGAGHDLDYERS